MLSMPWQNPSEWLTFLHLVECHLKYAMAPGRGKPVAVEIGVFQNKQKAFYEALGMEHIGIDISADAEPDILGHSALPSTSEQLLVRLAGRPITVLFIDGDHNYEAVRTDWAIYAPLTQGIVALHDIFNHKYGVEQFWRWLEVQDSLRDRTFITIHAKEGYANHGIGVIKNA